VFLDRGLLQQAATQRLQPSRLKLLLGAAFLLVVAALLTRRINHDEGQYVAAIALTRHGLPYRDFAYLQTPLQPLLLAPLALVPAGWLLVAARAVNGLFAWASLALVALALEGRARRPAQLIAVAALACTDAFLLAGSLARNDALPMMLLAGAVAALMHALGRAGHTKWFALAGLLLGLAASAKISFAFPAAGAALFVLLRSRQLGWRTVAAFVGSGLAGLLPTIVLALLAPANFAFDVFTYALHAPQQWWSSVGRGYWLEPSWRLIRLIGFAAKGSILVALGASLLDRRARDDHRLLLDLMIVGGLLAAYLPDPAFTQYLVPLLPPLFTRFGMALSRASLRTAKPLLALTLAGCVLGVIPTIRSTLRWWVAGPDLFDALDQGRAVAAIAKGGRIVTLAPEYVAGADTNLDPRFVTGPFLFRTFDGMADQALAYGKSPGWQHAGEALDRAPPFAIVTGNEAKTWPAPFSGSLEAPLIAWAKAHRYRAERLEPFGLIVFVHP
jgi:hypothetical protein